jgi:NAD-dependent deacetylase
MADDMKSLIRKAARALAEARYAIALTGAGISTESGIADFRGPSGLWTKNPEAERQSYLFYDKFLNNPKSYWIETLSVARSPGLGNLWDAQPNPGHFALAELEKMGILKYVITQNIDALHEKAGSQRVLEYHGNFMKLRCVSCGARYWREEFDLEQLKKEDKLPPRCPRCRGILKSDTVSFGESIPGDVAAQSLAEAQACDLMLICGTSAVVYPFAGLPVIARERSGVTIIEVNAEATPLTKEGVSDYLIQGKTGEILPALVEAVNQLNSSSGPGGFSTWK